MAEDGATGTRGERTRATVTAVATARFAEHGFEGTTVSRIAADAGVSQATVLFHFGSKSGLLVAVMQAYYDDLLTTIDDLLDATESPEERLRSFARWWLSHNAENLPLLSVLGRQGRRSDPDEVVVAFREANRRVTRFLDRLVEDLKHSGTLRPEVPTRIVRDAFFGTAEHLMVGRATTGRPRDLNEAADDLVSLLLHGAAAPAPTEPDDAVARIEAKLDRVLDGLAG